MRIQGLEGCAPNQLVTFSKNQPESTAEGKEARAEGGACAGQGGSGPDLGVPRPVLESPYFLAEGSERPTQDSLLRPCQH